MAAALEFNNLTVPVIMKDTHFHIVDDWGSFEATPAYDAPEHHPPSACHMSDYLSDGYIPVHMDSASELADYLDHMREQMTEATTRHVEDDGRLDARTDDRRRPARLLRRP